MTILVGVDESGPSRAALAWALRRAEETLDTVELVHVIHDDMDDATELLASAQSIAHEFTPRVAVGFSQRRGAPAAELVAAAAPEDLLVVGTHKTGYVYGRILGTFSLAVASNARCSLAVIPDGAASGRRGIVVGVVGEVNWRPAVAAGAAEAMRRRDELVLVHADSGRDEDGGAGRELLAEALAHARTVAGDITVRTRRSRRRPSDALLDASRSAALLVLGAGRKHTGFAGSVTHEVLLNINSPVLLAR